MKNIYEVNEEAVKKIAERVYDNGSTVINRNDLEEMFPELAELEDERIRKEIIDFATKANNGVTSILANNYDFNKWIAWLEKQGEQKRIKIPKFESGDTIEFNGLGHNRYTIKDVCGTSHYINTNAR